ncbi:MAG: hypothetical protein IJD71_05125 [Clostridia bacterium]|nr:hypothetical protein [Clostridia bacterium]
MKKLLAILLVFCLMFTSHFSFLAFADGEDVEVDVGTSTTQKIILESDFDNSDGTNWQGTHLNVTFGDDNGDEVNDYARVKIGTKSGAGLVSSPFNLIPGNEYELTYYIRVPEESVPFVVGTTFYAPTTVFYQPNKVNDAGTKVLDTPAASTEEASNNYYAYKGSDWARREGFAATWTIDGYQPKTKDKFSNFGYSDHKSVLGATNANINEAFANWTKVTVNFTAMAAAEGETSQVAALGFYYMDHKSSNNFVFDIKDVKLVENPAGAEEPEQPEEPEEPEAPAIRGPEVNEGFEDFAAGTKLYDHTLTGTQNMYAYSSKAQLLTNFGSLEVSGDIAYNGSEQSLKGTVPNNYLAMPVKLDANTEYELSFWYLSYPHSNRYLSKITYGLFKPVAGIEMSAVCKTTKAFASTNALSNSWQKATLNFTTGDDVENLVFAYWYQGKYYEKTDAVTSFTLYIDDVSIVPVAKATTKANLSIEHKDAASVDVISGYYKDFVVGEKIQFKVRTKDALVPTVTVNGNAVTADKNGKYSFFAQENNIIKVVCEGDENRQDPNNYNGLPLYEYNQEVAVTPVWEGNVVYHETVFFSTGRETAKLLYPINKVVAVRSYDLAKTYLEGVDYEIAEDGTLKILEGSQIPVYEGSLESTHEGEHNSGDCNEFPKVDENGNVIDGVDVKFVDDFDYPAYAVNVTYEHSDVWTGDEGYNPEAVQSVVDKVPNLIKKLENGEDVEVVILGDSLSCGRSASGQNYDDLYDVYGNMAKSYLNFPPFTPAWPVMLEQTLKTLYPDANITFKNIAHGGKTAKWGSDEILTRLGYLERDYGWTNETPDLLILAYGGNDMTAGYTAEQFKGYMQSIITQYRGYKQDANAEVLLWTETRHHTQVAQHSKANHEAYRNAYYELVEENGYVGLVDTLNVFNEVVQSKLETDLYNDCVIHVNDFATRVIVQSFVAALTVPAGDLNGTGTVDAEDVTLFAKHFAGWEGFVLDPTKLDLDFSGDGKVNLYDLVRLAQIAAKW